jgi:uncharacterized protein YutE (UPF0331/DUF86 family)
MKTYLILAQKIYDVMRQRIGATINKMFGLRNDLVHRLRTPHFFVWFVE